MTISEAIALCVKHHPNPSRQLKHYYKWKIVLAGMRGEIGISYPIDDEGKSIGETNYDRESFMRWLRSKPVAVYLDADVKLALDGRTRDEVNEFVNEAVREKLK